jgi:hypothetical protein
MNCVCRDYVTGDKQANNFPMPSGGVNWEDEANVINDLTAICIVGIQVLL